MSGGSSSESGAGAQSSRLGGGGGATQRGAEAEAPAEDAARTAGRGFLMITAAKGWFMVMGAAVSIGLPILMSPKDFGVYSIVLNAMSLLNMVVVTGMVQAVAKLVSEHPGAARRVVRQAALLQCGVGLPLGLAYIAGAGQIAAWFNDPSLTELLRVSGGVMLAYAFYAIFVGALNGVKAFGRQAMLDVSFATLKTAMILGLVAAGFGVMGAIGGFVVAAWVITLAAGVMVLGRGKLGLGAADPEHERLALEGAHKKLASFLVLVMLYMFGINGVLRADLFLLKALIADATEVGLNADEVSGVYAAMQNLARLPYQAVIAVTFVVFPMISQATFKSDMDATRVYIRSTLRYSFLLLVLLGVLLAGNAQDLILALFGDRYAAGGPPLMVLSTATIGFALFYIATTVITGAGRPHVAVGLSAVMLALTVGLNLAALGSVLAPGVVVEDALMAAASATAGAMVLGCGLSVAYLVWRYRAGLPLGTLVRVALVGALVLAALALMPTPEGLGKLARLALVVGKGGAGALVFVGGLALLREFQADDKDRLMRVLRRKRSSAKGA